MSWNRQQWQWLRCGTKSTGKHGRVSFMVLEMYEMEKEIPTVCFYNVDFMSGVLHVSCSFLSIQHPFLGAVIEQNFSHVLLTTRFKSGAAHI